MAVWTLIVGLLLTMLVIALACSPSSTPIIEQPGVIVPTSPAEIDLRPTPTTPLTAEHIPTTTPASTPFPTPSPTAASTPRPTATPTPPYFSAWNRLTNARWLEQNDPALASKIQSLSWVADGLDDRESRVLQELLYIAILSRPVVSNIVQMTWVQDGIDEQEAEPISWIDNSGDAGVALSVTEFAWVRDGIEELEARTIEELSYIGQADSEVAAVVMALSWVQDGIEDLEFQAIDWINNFGSEQAMKSVTALGWVRDGIQEMEPKAIEELSYIDYEDSEDSQVVMSVIALPWVQDGIEQRDVDSIQQLRYVVMDDVEVAAEVVGLGWLEDSIDDMEFKALVELRYFNYGDSEVAASVVELEWVRDGIEDLEAEAIDRLNDFNDAEVASSVVALGWVQDGIEEFEASALVELYHLDKGDSNIVSRVVAMPFIETLEPSDASALKSLAQLASSNPNDLRRVVSHPTLSNGITDDWAKVVATLSAVAQHDPPAIDQLLDPAQVNIEERLIELPLGGETVLAVIRVGSGAESSMDELERAVTYIEQLVGHPFPARYVALLFGESVTPGASGNYFGTHITVLPEYDADGNGNDAEYAHGITTHETAHYYWHGQHAWLDEGLANTTTAIVINRINGTPIEPGGPPCPHMSTIADLESSPTATEPSSEEWTCNYDLGERLFMDLYHSLGSDLFSAGLGRLYGSLVTPDDQDTTEIEHVKAAFGELPGIDSSVVTDVIGRWYDGVVPYDLSGIDTNAPNPGFLSVNGRIDVAYLATEVDGVPATRFTASPLDGREVWLFLDYSYNVSRTREVQLELVTYYEDRFAFKRQSVSLEAKPQWAGGSWWLNVGAWSEDPWAEGTYWVHVYNEGRKLVELEYEVTE